MACCPCGNCPCYMTGTAGNQPCYNQSFTVTAAGFSAGDCNAFNGTFTLTHTVNQSIGGNQYKCLWTDSPAAGSTITFDYTNGPSLASDAYELLFQNAAGTATYTSNDGNVCTPGNHTFTRSTNTACTTAPATVTLAPATQVPFLCNGCLNSEELPNTLTAVITNSTVANVPNGTYTLTIVNYGGGDSGIGFAQYRVAVTGGELNFYIESYEAHQTQPSCGNWFLTYTCIPSQFSLVSTTSAGCTCSPFSVSGHCGPGDGSSIDRPCFLKTNSFDWTVHT